MKKTYLWVVVIMLSSNFLFAQDNKNILSSISKSILKTQEDSIKKLSDNKGDSVLTKAKNISEKLNVIRVNPTQEVEKVISEKLINSTKTLQEQKIPSIVSDNIKKTEKIQNAITSPQTLKETIINSFPTPVTSELTLVSSKVGKSISPLIKITNKIENISKKISNKSVFSLDLTVGLSNYSINMAQVVPAMGLRITKYYTVGIGLPIRYNSISINNLPHTDNLLAGVRLYHRVNLPFKTYLQVENEILKQISAGENLNITPAMFLGGGYNLDIGKKYGFSILLLYNPLYKEGTFPYSFPLDVRVGLNMDKTVQSIFNKR